MILGDDSFVTGGGGGGGDKSLPFSDDKSMPILMASHCYIGIILSSHNISHMHAM